MIDRVNEIKAFGKAKGGYDKLPDDALAAITKVVDELGGANWTDFIPPIFH
jgi:phosphoenolpyruvate carboxykinase (ATP)